MNRFFSLTHSRTLHGFTNNIFISRNSVKAQRWTVWKASLAGVGIGSIYNRSCTCALYILWPFALFASERRCRCVSLKDCMSGEWVDDLSGLLICCRMRKMGPSSGKAALCHRGSYTPMKVEEGGSFVSWKTPKGLFAFLSCKFRTWWLCRCDFTPVRQLARSQAMLITGQSLLHSHTRYTCMLRTEAWCLCTHQTHPTLLYPSNSQAVIPSSPSFALIVRVSLCVSAEPVTCLGFDRSVCIGT